MVVKTRVELDTDLSTGGSSDNKIETRFAKDLLDSITLTAEDTGGGGGGTAGRYEITLSAAGTLDLPAESVITGFIVSNKSANDVTGGLKLGNASGGSQYINNLPATADTVFYNPSYDFSSTYVETGANTLYIDAITSWNGATVTLVIFTETL